MDAGPTYQFAKKGAQIIGYKTLNDDINKNTTVPKATKSFSDKMTIDGNKYSVELIKPSKASQSPSEIIVGGHGEDISATAYETTSEKRV